MTNTGIGLLTRDDKTGEDFEVAHGVHVECQYGRPMVKAICGAELDWEDEDPDNPERCVVCLDLLVCPVCGARLALPR